MTEENNKKVIVYSTPTCMYCNMLKAYFEEKGVEYENIDVQADPERGREMVEATGQMGVPVTKIGEEYIVGFNQPVIAEKLGLS